MFFKVYWPNKAEVCPGCQFATTLWVIRCRGKTTFPRAGYPGCQLSSNLMWGLGHVTLIFQIGDLGQVICNLVSFQVSQHLWFYKEWYLIFTLITVLIFTVTCMISPKYLKSACYWPLWELFMNICWNWPEKILSTCLWV